MSVTQDGGRITLAAGADLSAKQYYIVKDSSGTAVLASAATDKILGVIENAPVSGDTAVVVTRNKSGTFKVKAGGVIAVGDKLTSDSAGKAVATTTGGDQVFGIARKVAADGDITEYLPVFEVV